MPHARSKKLVDNELISKMWEIQVDKSSICKGILKIRIRPYGMIVLGLVFSIGSCVGFVSCFAPFDHVPYDKKCLDDDGRSAFPALVAVLFGGWLILYCIVSCDDFHFDRNADELRITRRYVSGTTEDVVQLRDICEVNVSANNGTARVEMRTNRLTVPLTSWYSSSLLEHNRASTAIEDFLGLATPNETADQQQSLELRPILVEAASIADCDMESGSSNSLLPTAVARPITEHDALNSDIPQVAAIHSTSVLSGRAAKLSWINLF